jgi:hypothetical protein
MIFKRCKVSVWWTHVLVPDTHRNTCLLRLNSQSAATYFNITLSHPLGSVYQAPRATSYQASLLRDRGVLNSNTGLETFYPDLGYLSFFSVPPSKYWDSKKSDNGHFLPHPLQFITHQETHHSTKKISTQGKLHTPSIKMRDTDEGPK